MCLKASFLEQFLFALFFFFLPYLPLYISATDFLARFSGRIQKRQRLQHSVEKINKEKSNQILSCASYLEPER